MTDNTEINYGSPISDEQVKMIVNKEDINLTAEYEYGKYTITYKSTKNAIITGTVKETVTYKIESLNVPSVKTTKGYKLTGWKANKDVTLKNGTIIKLGKNISINQLKQVLADDNITFTPVVEKTSSTIYYSSYKDRLNITGKTKEVVINGKNPKGTTVDAEKVYWKANNDVTLKDGTIIKAGERITSKHLKQIIVTEDLKLTAFSDIATDIIKVPDTASVVSKIGIVLGIIFVFGGIYILYKRIINQKRIDGGIK